MLVPRFTANCRCGAVGCGAACTECGCTRLDKVVPLQTRTTATPILLPRRAAKYGIIFRDADYYMHHLNWTFSRAARLVGGVVDSLVAQSSAAPAHTPPTATALPRRERAAATVIQSSSTELLEELASRARFSV
eukprot:6177944-Pleurochrysis_carterae.AAC.2